MSSGTREALAQFFMGYYVRHVQEHHSVTFDDANRILNWLDQNAELVCDLLREAERMRDALNFVAGWVANPVSAYSTAALDGMFALTRDRIVAVDMPQPDPRDPDHSRPGIFAYHNCSRCDDGKRPCKQGNPRQCEFPIARND